MILRWTKGIRREAESGSGGTGCKPKSSSRFGVSDPATEDELQHTGSGAEQTEADAPTAGRKTEGATEAEGQKEKQM